MVGEIGVANQRADAEAAIGGSLDAVEPGQMRYVDEASGLRDAALHQVEQIGAGSEIGGARSGAGLHRVGDGVWSDVVEIFHAVRLSSACVSLSCASSTASVMPA